MRICAFLLTLLALTTPLFAQDDKTYLEGLLQDTLSAAGREVTITGFAGALSSKATLKQMTVSDDDGVWLTMRDATLIWSRSALLSGKLEINELSAAEIEIARLPGTGGDLSVESTEARPFALPELPVSVNIGEIRAETIRLGPTVLGEPATLALEGHIELASGAGLATLDLRRTDRDDRLKLDGAFSNTTRVLKLDLDFDEAAGGLVSKTIGIPGDPALRLIVQGEAPMSDYTARIALAADGQDRFGGTVSIAAAPEETDRAHDITAALSGDVRPLFTADLHRFFGPESRLDLRGATLRDGGMRLDKLALVTGATDVSGSLALSPAGWPERFALTGQIGEGDTLALPLSGPATTLTQATITARYDAAQGDEWSFRADMRDFARDGLRVAQAHLSGTGRITRGALNGLDGTLRFDTRGLTHDDARLNRALGAAPSGKLAFEWAPDTPLEIMQLVLRSGDLDLTARGSVDQLKDGLPVTGEAALRSADFSRFAGLLDRPIAGRGQVALSGRATLLGGLFNLDMTARTEDLKIGIDRLDPLLGDPAQLVLKARRDETGTTLDRLTLQSDTLDAQAAGRLNSQSGQLELTGRLSDIARVEPRLSGPATLETRLDWTAEGDLTLSNLTLEAAGAELTGSGTLRPDDPALPATGQVRLKASDLARFAALAGRPLRGAVTLRLDGAGELAGTALDASFDLSGTGIRSGIAELDALVAGKIEASGALTLGGDLPDLRYLKLDTTGLKLNASGDGPGKPVTLSLRLADLGRIAPGFNGQATAQGSVVIRDREARRIDLDLNATGPGGIVARIVGQIGDYGQAMALGITGNAPLGLANRFISPRSIAGPATYALRLDGPPALASLSGRVELRGARVALPDLNYAIRDLSGLVALSGGRATLDISGNAGTGGQFQVAGPVGLTAPYQAGLQIMLTQLGLSDPKLYETRIDGALDVSGPLTGGASISGTIDLDKTELRVPSGSGTIVGTLPELTHIAEPAAVAATRSRAGLTGEKAGPPARPFPLDVTIRAPRKIFVRGRGLDAELGGQIRLTGTTADIRPIGVFELSRGRLDILGQRLVLTEGLIDLRGTLDPYLRFVAETETDELIVRVILEGQASEPTVTFTSEPELPEEEVVARLLFGKDLTSMSAFQAAQLVSAVATLSGRFSGGLTGKLRNSLGLSDLDIATTDEGATEVRAGAYISDRVYSEIAVDSEGNQELNLNLDVGRFVTIKGGTSTTGDTGIGIFFERDY